MAKEYKNNPTSMEACMDEHTYPTSVDKLLSADTTGEGTANSLPPAASNPIMGADGVLPVTKITKVKS